MTTKILAAIVWMVCLNGCRGQSLTRYTYTCQTVDAATGSVLNIQLSSNFEVVAGKPFAYGCEYFVETTGCDKNPNSLECGEIELIWTLPATLQNLEQESGETRLVRNFARNSKDGYDLYRSWFNISAVGRLHEGEYIWQENLRFQDRTVNQASFHIQVIDLIQNSQPCSYADSCESNYCTDGQCASGGASFPWFIVGTVIGAVIILSLVVVFVALLVIFKRKKSNNRRDN